MKEKHFISTLSGILTSCHYYRILTHYTFNLYLSAKEKLLKKAEFVLELERFCEMENGVVMEGGISLWLENILTKDVALLKFTPCSVESQ